VSKTKEVVFALVLAVVSIAVFFGLPIIIDKQLGLERGTTIGYFVVGFIGLAASLWLYARIKGVSSFEERLAKFRSEQQAKSAGRKQ